MTAPGKAFEKGSDLYKALVAAANKLKGKVIFVTAKTERCAGVVGSGALDVVGSAAPAPPQACATPGCKRCAGR